MQRLDALVLLVGLGLKGVRGLFLALLAVSNADVFAVELLFELGHALDQ